MKNFKIKMLCRLLTLAMLISLINIPTSFADNALVMQVGSNGSAVVDKVSTASTVKTSSSITNVGGQLLQGKLENANQTPYVEMTQSGAGVVDVDNDFLNNINDATFEMWFDNNFSSDDTYHARHNRYLFGLYDETNAKEVYTVKTNNGTTYGNRGYGFNAYINEERVMSKKMNDYNMYDDWVHLVVTFDTFDDGAKTKIAVYKNGVFVFDNTIENIDNGDGTYTSAISSTDMRLRLGHSTPKGTHDAHYGFVGRYGDVKVYNYLKTASDISSVYSTEKALYINDLSTNFAIEKHDGKGATYGTQKVEACAVTADGAYVLNPYALGGTVKVTFTSPVNKNSISEETINLVDINGNVVPGSTSVTLSDMGYVAYITYGQLTEGAQYAVKLNGLKSVNNIVLNTTSQYFTFTGGTAENGIILVRPFKGKTIEFTLNYPLSADKFEAEKCLIGTDFGIDDATYDEATRTITLLATDKLKSGKEYTVGYDGVTKTFTAVADGEFVIEVPVAPEEVAPQIPIAPVEPADSLLMNISVANGQIVDTTGNGTVTPYLLNKYSVSGKIQKGYIANKNHTPYIEFTDQGAGMLEVNSEAIEGVENMTFDVWVKNDNRNIYSTQTDVNNYRYNNTLFAIVDPTVTDKEPYYFHMGLQDGSPKDVTAKGYGFYGASRVNLSQAINGKARYSSDNSSLWDEWTHLVITTEKPADDGPYYTTKYYINGEKILENSPAYKDTDAETGETINRFLWNDTVLRIGHIDSTGAYGKWTGFKGKISEFKVFNYAKTEADIKAQYEAQKYNYVEDLSDKFTLELVEASKKTYSDFPYGAYAGGGKIKATFSAAINPDTINENSLTLVDASGNVIPGGVEVELSEQGTVAYITYGAVAVDAEYYLKVYGLQSMNGVPLKVTSSEAITFIEGREEGLEDGILLVKPFKGNTIDITLNYALKAEDFDASKAILSAGGYDFDNTTATYDEATRTITLTAKDNFVQRGKYLFTYDGKAKNFIAEEYVEPVEPITIGTPVFKDQAGNVLTSNTVTGVTSICSDVNVVTDGMTEFVAILSVYCGGQLVDVDMLGTNNSGSVNKFTNEVTELNSAYTYTFDLEVNALDETKDYTSKLMLWDTFSNMAPYAMYVPSSN